MAALSKTAGDAIATYIKTQGLAADGLAVGFDAPSATVTVAGTVADQATKEKVTAVLRQRGRRGQGRGPAGRHAPQPEAQWHTVVSGDNLSKIAKKFYGDANKYPVIFEANKPMLSHPDKIYPGQVLRIPPL